MYFRLSYILIIVLNFVLVNSLSTKFETLANLTKTRRFVCGFLR